MHVSMHNRRREKYNKNLSCGEILFKNFHDLVAKKELSNGEFTVSRNSLRIRVIRSWVGFESKIKYGGWDKEEDNPVSRSSHALRWQTVSKMAGVGGPSLPSGPLI